MSGAVFAGFLDDIVSVCDFLRTLLCHFAHAFRKAPPCEFVGVIFTHQLAIDLLELRIADRRGYPQNFVSIVILLSAGPLAASLPGMGTAQHGFQLIYLAFRQAKAAGYANQHCVLSRVHYAIRRNRRNLHLKKHLQESWLPTADA